MRQIIVTLLPVIFNVLCAVPIPEDLVVTLPDGKIHGTTYVTDNRKEYYGFQGIPYASPPVGELRFESPQPTEPWTGIWDATEDSKICVSSAYLQQPEIESEDCLYINVYVPNIQTEEKLSVMFWIYGGAFTGGSSLKSLYGPDFLIEQNVIVVSFNYRLNAIGFLSTGDKALPGNFGLKDQVLALKWTQQNIVYFGGDPEKITIFGQSAGGTSVGLHLISKQSAGLFRAAILESGSALVPWSFDWDSRNLAFLLADAISGGTYGNNTQALKEFLKKCTLEQIMTAYGQLPSGKHPYPTIEVESEDAFVSDSHYELLASGDFNRVPILIGVCSEESLMALANLNNAKKVGKAFDRSPATLIPDDLRPNSSDAAEVIEKIKSIYLNEGETFANNLVGVAKYFTDNRYARGVVKQAELSSTFVPVYLYEFAYYGRPLTPAFIDGAGKAGHAAELPFLFNYKNMSFVSESDSDLLTQNRLVTLWANFAKYLNPTPEEVELLSNITWPLAGPQNLQYLSINDTLEIRSNYKKRFYASWDDIFDTYGTKPFITF